MPRMPRWLYEWIDLRGRIPPLVRALWPQAHFCADLDWCLIEFNVDCPGADCS